MKECLNWPKQRCIHSDMLLPSRANSEHIKKSKKSQMQSDFFFSGIVSLLLTMCSWRFSYISDNISTVVFNGKYLMVNSTYRYCPPQLPDSSCAEEEDIAQRRKSPIFSSPDHFCWFKAPALRAMNYN